MSHKIQFEDIIKSIYSDDDFDYSTVKHKDEARICLACKKEFYPVGRNAWRQKYCNRTHYINCIICGEPIKMKTPTIKYGDLKCTCSKECEKIFRRDQTIGAIQDLYDHENISQVPEFKDKISAGLKRVAKATTAKRAETMQRLYGGVGTASPELRKKIEATMQRLYNVTNPDESEVFRNKIREKLQSEEVQEMKRETCRKKYGTDYPAQSEEVQRVMMQTCMERYDVPYIGQCPEIREKAAATCLERYDVPYYCLTPECKEKSRQAMIANRTGRVSQLNLNFLKKLKENGFEDAETEFYLGGKWFDEVIPSRKIVIELDPSYTHSDLPNHWEAQGIPSDYHIMKTRVASENGYRCIHVFDWDYWDAIVDYLIVDKVIYARNCTLCSISREEAKKFINENHLQGDARGAKFCYGLYYSNELVSVMTFGKPRYNKKYEWELLRLCTKSHYQVIGGASRMFKRFLSDAQPASILSYCDKAKFTGEVYARLGFTLSHESTPSKVWSKGDKYITDNLLRQRGFDQLFNTNYGKGTSNEELMINSGWRSVYDCGQLVFEWRNEVQEPSRD